MGMNIRWSASANGTRNVGLGGGANLRARNLFTADDMHIDGLYWVRPYDMENDFGAEGAAIAAAKGARYAFLMSSDHWSGSGWNRGNGVWCAWGNDPGNYPPPDAFRMVIPMAVVADGFTFIQSETPWLVYNPDDLPDHPFHIYVHSVSQNGLGQRTQVYRSDDMDNWTAETTSSHQTTGGYNGHVGYQQVTRNGTGDWESIGLGSRSSGTSGYMTRWTSTDGLSFTATNENLDTRVATSDFIIHDGTIITIGAQDYRITREDNFDTTLNANPSSTPGATRIGQYVSAVPVGATGAVATNDLNDVIRISDRYAGNYPGPDYLQSVSAFAEDGVAHIWACHGFFSDVGLIDGADYEDGGGYDDELVDYYTYIYDATAAAQAAPVGVRWSCSAGVVTLEWYNALPNNTYRVYRGTTSGTQATLIGDVTGTSTTNSPGTGVFYYKVVTMEGATERGHRIIRVYSSSNSALINKHIDRVTAAGVTAGTIDEAWLTDVEEWLDSEGLKSNLLYWADPAFGCIKDGSDILSKVFCLGSTLKPRGGDYTPTTTSTTYSATGLNSTVPAWVNGANTAFGYFGGGRLNNIRRKTALTLVAVYQKSGTALATLFGNGEFANGFSLQNTSGSPGAVSVFAGASGWSATATGASLTNGVAHIIGGTITGSQATPYLEGVAGTPAACTDTLPLRGQAGSGQCYFLGSGCYGSKSTSATTSAESGPYVFSNNQALFTASDLIVFDAALSASQMASLNVLLRARIGV